MTLLITIKKTVFHWLSRAIHIRGWNKYVWIVLVLTLVGGFLRFYKLYDSVMFLGDQGRDAIVVSRIFTNADPVFIGPVTSVGNMYLGPFYYYFMLPFLWLSYPSPMGPVYAVAFAGTVLLPLTYIFGSRMLGKRAAILATALLTLSNSAISLSRFSWNPNLMPLMGLVWFYCLFEAARGRRWYWIGVALALAILIQLHYIALLVVGVSGLVWIWRLIAVKRQGNWKTLITPSLLAILIMFVSQLPLLLFDTRHDWLNVRMFLRLLQGEDAFANERSGADRLLQIVTQSQERISQLIAGITLDMKYRQGVFVAYGVVGAVVIFWSREKRQLVHVAVQLLLLTILVSLIGLSIYKNDVYLHYLGFLLPLVFLMFGYVLDRLIQLNKWNTLLVGAALTVFAWQNLASLSYVGGGPRLPMLQATAAAIHKQVQVGEPYTIMLISESKDLYGMNYRYFLTTNHAKQPLDPEQFGSAKKLFVIWEDKKVAEPLKLPLYELLVFDVATPSAVFDVPNGPSVLELRKG